MATGNIICCATRLCDNNWLICKEISMSNIRLDAQGRRVENLNETSAANGQAIPTGFGD